jgi:fructose-1,6-bisphosphatase
MMQNGVLHQQKSIHTHMQWPQILQTITGGFSVVFDPLDGSSIVNTNFTVGTIFGVWLGRQIEESCW